MSIKPNIGHHYTPGSNNNYTYPQFVIDEKTGRVEVNFIDWATGRVVRHIPAAELNEIVRDQGSISSVQIS